MAGKKVGGAGLRGQVAGQTSLSTVGVSGSGLTYRGYDLVELAEKCVFEEIAYLLLRGELPNQTELDEYKTTLQQLRELPDALKITLEQIPKEAHPMDVLRTGCSMLGNIEPEISFDDQLHHADRMIATFPAIIAYWYHYSHTGERIETTTDDESLAGYFLHLLHQHSPSEQFINIMNVSLILYAEHEFNASTFAARVCASTLSDIHSSICAAIGTLRGPLHGGANEAAHAMLAQWHTPDEAEEQIMHMLTTKQLIMGFGHAVYTESDPRNMVIKEYAKELSTNSNNPTLYEISQRVEMVMKREKNLFANADFYHASTYEYMNIPVRLFTPIFVCSRVTGWCAHIIEQRANNRIIRPNAEYIGLEPRAVPNISQR